jgi:hypothetical protein
VREGRERKEIEPEKTERTEIFSISPFPLLAPVKASGFCALINKNAPILQFEALASIPHMEMNAKSSSLFQR